MTDYATLLLNHIMLKCRCIDRILLQGYVSKLQTVGQVFLANSELPSFPRPGRIVAILRFSDFQTRQPIKPGYSKANVLVRRTEA
jgi:hypothetical protein